VDRDSKRGYMARGSTLVAIVLVHGLIISALLTRTITVRSVATPQPMFVTIIDKPSRPPTDRRLPTLKLNLLRPILLPHHVPAPIYEEPPPPPLQVLDSEQTASTASSVGSSANGIGSKASGAGPDAAGGGRDISVVHRVKPIYPPASMRAREQGYVVLQVLVDEKGQARTVEVVRSSGYPRLDESAVDAIRKWTFTPAEGSAGPEARIAITWEFELSPPNLAAVPVAVMPFDTELARQIHVASTAGIKTDVVSSRSARALDALIKKLLAFESGVKEPPGPIPPIRLLAKWGAVSSIRFVGNRDGGFDLESNQWIDPPNMEEIHWAHYEVKQPGGMSEWLVAVSRDGAIRNAQAMICPPARDVVIGCP
jgi:periplasmic protein TonB